MNSVVLDASAILAAIRNEPGGELVSSIATGALLSTVNLAEVMSRLIETNMREPYARAAIDRLGPNVIAFDASLAYAAARLRPRTRHLHLSLADRACLALALQRRLPVLTADRVWTKLKLGIEIRVVRAN